MITNTTLLDVQSKLMDIMTALYLADKDDQIAKDIAGYLITLHEAIDIELLERMMSE